MMFLKGYILIILIDIEKSDLFLFLYLSIFYPSLEFYMSFWFVEMQIKNYIIQALTW